MAIKIKGTEIIDDDKNIKDNTGLFSDANNSALRPKSSSGTSFIQRWSGSSWQDLASFNDDGISFNRNVNISGSYDLSVGDNVTIGNNLSVTGTSHSKTFYHDGNTAIRAANYIFGQVSLTGNLNGTSWGNTFFGKRENWPSNTQYNRVMLETSFIKCEGGLAINTGQPMPFGSTVAGLYIHQQSGGISWSFSSRRNKTNIEDIDIDYKKILNLRPVIYEDLWIQHPEFDEETNRIKIDKLRVGLIAEEVYDQIPEICEFGHHYLDEIEVYDLDSYGSKINLRRELKPGAVPQAVNVNYDRLSVLIVGLLKEMNNEIESLKKENKDLRIEIENIRSILNNNNLS